MCRTSTTKMLLSAVLFSVVVLLGACSQGAKSAQNALGDDGGYAVQSCNLQTPTSIAVAAGATTPWGFARVIISGASTDQPPETVGQPLSQPSLYSDLMVTAQVGYGPAGSDPDTSSGWTWNPMTFNQPYPPSQWEYQDMGFAAPTIPGAYALAGRFSLDEGQTWTDCDVAGDVPYDTANQGTLTVTGPNAIDWCNLQYPTALTGTANGLTPPVYARVHTTDSPIDPINIAADIGFGPAGSDPSMSSTGWTWLGANYNASCSGCGPNLEYDTALNAPSASGTYALASRFSLDGRMTFTYCDTAGDQTYDPSNAGTFTVSGGQSECPPAGCQTGYSCGAGGTGACTCDATSCPGSGGCCDADGSCRYNSSCSCAANGGTCSGDADCCSGVCTGGTCACAAIGASCAANGDCCSNFCDSLENGQCAM